MIKCKIIIYLVIRQPNKCVCKSLLMLRTDNKQFSHCSSKNQKFNQKGKEKKRKLRESRARQKLQNCLGCLYCQEEVRISFSQNSLVRTSPVALLDQKKVEECGKVHGYPVDIQSSATAENSLSKKLLKVTWKMF